ncbi:hypothetical protein [Marinicrinis sediminis]|uniref:Copper chaperone PCu(A)C n=1 Tax=Marinicrinis sediminis TaxID=1652465 RepID=A0ABW5RBW2_9BACL
MHTGWKQLSMILLGCLLLIPHTASHAAETVKQEWREQAQPAEQVVEVFDIKQGKVVERIPYTAAIGEEAGRLLQSVSGLVTRIQIDPKKGTALRIPITPPLKLDKPFYKGMAVEMFVFLERSERPYVLVFNEEQKPILMFFDRDPQALMQLLHLQD